ncbi:MAG TPA: DUF433 domain-containing protein [Fimbriimonadaceae bacterium]|nr:DUF433 domain-containing protein [Fimbriimonadaceae bacterium]
MNIPTELQDILVANPETLSGAVRFKGTRVPVQALLDTLTRGSPVDDFLDGFPDVSREQALAVVMWEQNHARQTFGIERVG